MTTGSVCSTTIDNKISLSNEDNTSSNNESENDSNNENKKTKTIKQTITGTQSRIECPCHNYTALSKIVDVISSGDRMRADSMIEWLNGSTDQVAIRQKRLLTCGKRFQCRFRYGTSFAILRAIRDACAPFQITSTMIGNSRYVTSLEENNNNDPASLKLKASDIKEASGSISYDQSFPPLLQHPGLSNILIPPSAKKNQDKINTSCQASNKESGTTPIINTLKGRKKKPKGRVQPQLIKASISTTSSPIFDDAHIPTDIDPKTTLNWGKRHHIETDKKDTKQQVVTAGATTVINTLEATNIKSKRRVQPQLIPVKAPSTSSSSSLACDHPHSTTNNNIQSATIDGANLPHQSKAESERDDLVKKQTKSSTKVSEAAMEQMDRLVDIYIALIKNMLVPSTPLEIHLLLDLLSIDTDAISINLRERSKQIFLNQSPKSKDENEVAVVAGSVLFFQPIFYGPERCIHFAQSVFTRFLKGIIQRLSPFLIKSLLGDNVFARRCPTVAEHLNKFLLENTTTAEWTPPTSESITGTHAIFSLPFEPDRDSRHNFKTPAEISMYQNREVTRDAFLSQLRVFITAKSRVFLPQQVDKVRETAQYESRKIIANISSHNMLWFAQFFCELLLQVGLAPVEEMDQELLQIVADDRDKLQKLHKRFFKKNPSRSSQTRAGFGSTSTITGRRNERYRNFNDSNSNEIKLSTIPAFQEALSYFPGYQEFFFIFLYSVNCYNFGMHLLHQVVKKTSGMVSNHSLSGLEKRTLDLELLARFLGFLIFSPNWHEENIDFNKLKPCIHSLDHGLDLLEAIGLPLSKLVQESWDGGYTFLIIPWVTELLKMSKWDSISQSSMNFRQILANLRFVQSFASRSSAEEYTACGSNMQQVSFHLETFFNEIFSLPKLTSLPDSTLVRLSHANPHSLDNHKIGLSKAAIYASSPHMEDLCDMIMISKNSIRRETKSSSIKPKKLKPSIVSTIVGIEARSYLGAESPIGKVAPTLSNANRKEALVDNSLHGKKVHAKNKLTDGFFHQHRDLKEICDFVVQQTLKTLSVDEIRTFVMKASEEFSIGIQSTETEIEEMQVRAFELSQEFLRNKLTKTLRKSLELFCRTGIQRRVIDVATNLSTDRGMETSHVIVRDLISSSTKTVLKQSESTIASLDYNSEKTKNNIDEATESATASIRNLMKKYSTISDCNSNIKHIEEALDRIECVTKSVLIPRENVLRDFFECILGLDPIAESVIDRVIQSSTQESWVTLCTFFRLLEQLALISGYWRNRMHSLLGDDLVNLISDCKFPSFSEKKKLLEKLTQSSIERKKSSSITSSDNQDDSKYEGIIEPVKIKFY
jgi:hypothetical protein